MTPKDWNTQEEAIAAAKAEILAAIGDADARLELGMVKSVQRGFSQLSSQNSTLNTLTIDINTIHPEKSIVLLNSADSNSSEDSSFALQEMDANSFTVYYSGVGSSIYRICFSWQVIEFY